MVIMRRRPRNIRIQKGFTLTELLVALVIVVMLTGMVMTGVNIGNKLYRQSKFQSQSENLFGLIDGSLRTPMQTLEISQFGTGNFIATCRAGNDLSKVYGNIHIDNFDKLEPTQVSKLGITDTATNEITISTDGSTLVVAGFALDLNAAEKTGSITDDKKRSVELLNKSAFQSLQVELTPSYKIDGDTGVVTTTINVTISDKSGELSASRSLVYKSSKVRTVLQEP